VDARLPADDQAVEIALMEAELAEAAAARARRDEIAAEVAARELAEAAEAAAREAAGEAPAPSAALTLAQVERAVKLGLLPPDALREAALAKGYAADDAELLVELALFAVPSLREGAQRREEIREELATRRIALDDLERAVLRGIRTLLDFETELAARGYGEDDIGLLSQLLAERVAVDMEGLRRKIRAALAKVENGATVEALEQGLTENVVDPGTVLGLLQAASVTPDAALVWVRLVLAHGIDG
jgi:hypothetical protein